MSDRIKLLRKDRKMSQEALGELVGLSQPSVAKWERGESEPTGSNIYYLATALNTSVKYLVTGKEEDNGVLDRDLLISSIKDVEEAARALGRDIDPQLKATLILQRYELGGSASFADIIGLF